MTERQCRKARRRPIPFDCKRGAGHEGKCSPYSLPPLTGEQWAALGASEVTVERRDGAVFGMPASTSIAALVFPGRED
jgi:hypothetical protein